MFPAHMNVFSATKVVVGKQTELELILSIGLVQNKKVNKVGVQIRTYFQAISKITILKVGRTVVEGHSIQRQEEQLIRAQFPLYCAPCLWP